MSLAQEQIWLRSLRAPENPSLYNETITIHGNGPFDVAMLERSLAEIVRRHEAWRTFFDVSNGAPAQVVHAAPKAVEILVLDLRDVPIECREARAMRAVSEQVQIPFDLECGPLLKAMLLNLDDANHRFVVIVHQGIVDGVSAYQIFPTELAALYGAFLADKPSPLSDLSIQFGDFSIWQRAWLSGHTRAQQLEYWRSRLRDPFPELEWPKRRPREMPETCAGAVLPFAVPNEVFEAADRLARSEGVTLFTTLLAGFATLLHSYTRQKQFVVGTLSPAGRKRAECQNLLGYFLNPVALRFDFSEEPTFCELLSQTSRIVSEAISHDDIPFESLQQELGLQRGFGSFLRVAISLQPKSPALGNGWQVTTMDAELSGSRWDFYLAFIQRDQRLEGRVQYNPALFDEKAIVATIEQLFYVLKIVTSGPAARIRATFEQPARD